MADGFSIPDLVKRWQELQQSGQTVSFEQLCSQCPENQEEVKEQLQAIASMVSFLGLDDTGKEGIPSEGIEACSNSTPQQTLPTGLGQSLPALCIPGYEILRELGHGRMGIVFAARQISLKRVVALKMIRGGVLARPDDVARFRQEAEAVARLQHPNIVQIFDIGEHEGKPFFSLEYVGEGSLDKLLAGNPQPPHEAAHLIEILAQAIQAAHDKGIVHRDLKPANVLLQETGVRRQETEVRGQGSGTGRQWPGVRRQWPGVRRQWPKVGRQWPGVRRQWPKVGRQWPGVKRQRGEKSIS